MTPPITSLAAQYPNAIHLNILVPGLEKFDLDALTRPVKDKWYNQTLCTVNDSVVRFSVVDGDFHWHKHDDDDEFFFVLSGRLLIDLEPRADESPGQVVELSPHQGFVVPKGVLHRPRSPERTVLLMVETAATQPTGD